MPELGTPSRSDETSYSGSERVVSPLSTIASKTSSVGAAPRRRDSDRWTTHRGVERPRFGNNGIIWDGTLESLPPVDAADGPASSTSGSVPRPSLTSRPTCPTGGLFPKLPRRGLSSSQPTSSGGADDVGGEDSGPVSVVVVDNDIALLAHAAKKYTYENEMGETGDEGSVESDVPPDADPVLYNPPSIPSTKRTLARWKMAWIRHVWEPFCDFCEQRFPDPDREMAFQTETWRMEKKSAMACAVFLVGYWVISCALITDRSLFDYYAYVGICGIITLPLPVLIAINAPLKHPRLYQPVLVATVWVWGYLIIIEMTGCQYFGVNTCTHNLYFALFGCVFGFPALAIILMRQNRLLHILAATAWVIFSVTLCLYNAHVPLLFSRNWIALWIYHAMLAVHAHYRERSERQLFLLRQQLNAQFRSVQCAQAMERKAQQTTKRFVSYIFHEVRVPLNTALLAVQNLEGEGVFKHCSADDAEMVHGLNASLSLMEQVLNDVLSFTRMENGNLIQARKPFNFHKAINVVALSHRVQAEVAGVELVVELDPCIDALGGVFIGDDMRLRQITSNLVSNALKFTHRGSVRIVTKLVYPKSQTVPPAPAPAPAPLGSERDPEKGCVGAEKRRHSAGNGVSPEKKPDGSHHGPDRAAVLRIEVHDTGVGLRESDVQDNRLFSPYVQTEIGRRQGGKGSGLGLALVMQIVKLSGGRLGVDSEIKKGSVFWFELPYQVSTLPLARHDSITPSSPVQNLTSEQWLPGVSELTTTPDGDLSPRKPLSPIATPQNKLPQTWVPPSSDRSDPNGRRAGSPPTPPSSPHIPTPLRTDTSGVGKAGEAAPLSALVVDDDPLTRKLMTRMIKRLGHNVWTAENGVVALKMIRAANEHPSDKTSPFDVVFLDNQMPAMSGDEVAREVRNLGIQVYIVGCTGNALREDQDAYIDAGADDILPKPLHQADIVKRLNEATRRRRAKAVAVVSGEGGGTGG